MKKILVETSARHIHLTQEDLEKVCGEGFQLSVKKDLSQPGQYVSNTKLTLVGPKNEIKGVSILGPVRKASQVEVSLTDARTLGVAVPIRESGDVANSAPIKIVGPVGEVELKEGLIVAKRHIHMTEADAAEFNVKNGEVVSVKLDNKDRSLVFGDVVVRVNNNFALAMHIDTDESNGAACAGEVFGEIVKNA